MLQVFCLGIESFPLIKESIMAAKKLSIVFCVLMTVLSGAATADDRGRFRSGHAGSFGSRHAGPGFKSGHERFGVEHRGIRPGTGRVYRGFKGRHLHDDRFRGTGYRIRGGFGFNVGDPFFRYRDYYQPYYSSRYYSVPALVVPYTPPVYIQQSVAPKVQQSESNSWYYCQSPVGYYPHVKECPAGWQEIAPQPLGLQAGYWYYCSNPAGYYPYVRKCSAMWQKVVP
jgi:hypothetical protein